jgi:hypothetical protein
MKRWFEKNSWILLCLFIAVVGLVEPLVPNAGRVTFTVCLLVFGWLYRKEIKAWLKDHTQEKTYIKLLSFFVFYGLILIIVWHFLPNPQAFKPSYANVEELLWNYLLLPFFCILIGFYLSQKAFERTMILFSLCTVLCGIFLLYAHFDIRLLFVSPLTFFEKVIQCRFTECDSHIAWVSVFLKNYSFFPTLGALAIIPFVWKYTGWRRVAVSVLFLFNVSFLIFTINRGTIIGFGLALVLIFFNAIRAISWKKKILWGAGALAVICIIIVVLPQSVKGRFVDMITETKLFFTAGHDSGSASIRLTIWKSLLSHADSFWLFGDGPIYATQKLQLYLADAGYQNYLDRGYIYHSQYLTYFHHFGIM